MKALSKIFLTATLVFITVTGVNAAVMATAPYDFDYASDDVYCTITNMGTKVAEDVLVEAVNYAGGVVDTMTVDIVPGAGSSLQGSATAAYCRFTVPGSTKKFVAGATYADGGVVQAHFPAR